jgi:GT2 family glycosyltransferase/glycosyltransferase involved in cell wall biosynthesis
VDVQQADIGWLTSKSGDPIFWPPERLGRPSAWWGHVPFAFWLIERCKPKLLVELGTHYGVSYAAFCEAVLRLGLATRCFAVDTWQGDAQAGYYSEEVYADLAEFHAGRYASFSQLVRKTFDEAGGGFADATIDLLHIDGCHTYEAARHDFDAWRPKLSERAVVLFHDTNERRGDFGVWRLFDELRRDAPSFEFLHCHGLGVLALGDRAPEAVKALCALGADDEVAAVRERFSHFGARWMELAAARDERAASAERERSLHEAVADRDAQILRSESELARVDENAGGLIRRMTELERVVTDKSAQVARAERDSAEARAQIEELANRAERLEEASRQRIAELEALVADGTAHADRAERDLAEVLAQGEELADRAERLEEASRQRIAELEATIADQAAHIVQAEVDSAKAEAQIEELANRAERLEGANRQATDRCDALTNETRRQREEQVRVLATLKRPEYDGRLPAKLTGLKRWIPGRRRKFRRLAREYQLIAASPLFDANWYLANNRDVAAANIDPAYHYLRYGAAEGRNPGPFFSTRGYLAANPDVAKAGLNPLLHFKKYGWREERALFSAELTGLDGAAIDDGGDTASAPRETVAEKDACIAENSCPRDRINASPWRRLSDSMLWLKLRAAYRHPMNSKKRKRFRKEHQERTLFLGRPTRLVLPIADYLPSELEERVAPAGVAIAIVVPVYKGLEETKRCLRSLLENCDDLPAEVIVIDDCSPDSRLSAWLSSLASEGRITLLRNESNMGFVASVNRGMLAAGSRDVVLVNSDTEAPKGWLRRLAGHAYSAPLVGTITPFSNNATICSWPTIKGGNLPSGKTVAEIDAAFYAANRGRQISIPTAVGFCMYIRRQCLEAVGLFDVETFGRGYGEENDFSMRAAAKGWKHLLACDIFVFHAGKVSFGDAAPELKSAWDILVRLHPDYPRAVAAHIEADEARPSRVAATAALFRNAAEPTILIVTHAFGGGTEKHIRDLMRCAADRANFLRLEPLGNRMKLSVPGMLDHPCVVFESDQVQPLLSILRSFGIERIHLHSWIGFELTTIRSLIYGLSVPFDVTIHDYFSVCPQINLLPNTTSYYCGEPNESVCNSCIAARPQFGATDITSWRRGHEWILNEASRVICPSEDALQRMARFAPHASLMNVPHETVSDSEWKVKLPRLEPGQRLRIGLIGVVARHKGLEAFLSAVMNLDSGLYEFHVVGYCEAELPREVRARVHVTGRYDEVDLARLLEEANLHVAWFPAAWPETYSYTLSAAITAELPIVSSRLGAFPERLLNRPLTWLVDSNSASADWKAIFGAVRDTLGVGRVTTRAPRKGSITQFYPSNYLKPIARIPPSTGGRISLRRNGKVSLLVMPDRYPNGMITPCGYIRLLQPIDAIAAQFVDVVATVTDLSGTLHRVADGLICQRHAVGSIEEADELVSHCRRNEMRLIYDLDDDLINIPVDHPESTTLTAKAVIVSRLLFAADAVWVSTTELRNRVSCLRPDAVVVRNGLDDRLWRLPQERTPGAVKDDVSIVYMGTATHDAELNFFEPIAVELKRRYRRNIHFDIVGVSARKNRSSLFERVVPGETAANYPGFVEWWCRQNWDIGVSPLLDTEFNRCKSAIKVMDYAALGLPVVASAHAEYEGAFDGDSGVRFVPNTVEAWVKGLSQLIDSEASRHSEGAKARNRYLKRHTLSSQLQERYGIIKQSVNQAPLKNVAKVLSLEDSTTDGDSRYRAS